MPLDPTLADLERHCRAVNSGFELTSCQRGKGWMVQARWFTAVGIEIYVQKGMQSQEQADMWLRLVMMQCLGQRDLLGGR